MYVYEVREKLVADGCLLLVGPGDGTQVPRFDSKCLYLLIHIGGPSPALTLIPRGSLCF